MKTKHIIFLSTVALVGWLAASLGNGAYAKYEEEVGEYQAVVSGDTLPLQAKVDRAREQLSELQLPNAPVAQRVETTVDANIAEAQNTNNLVDRLLSTAFQYIGVRYRSGQSSPTGFDCSGFTSYVFKQQNIHLTRSSRSQYTEGEPIASVTELRKGDLVFFGGSRGGRRVGHVGIVTEVNPQSGNFKFIHASTSSGIRVDDSSDAYYRKRYVGARRIVK